MSSSEPETLKAKRPRAKTDDKAFFCPKCRKQRLIRSCDHVLSEDTKELQLPNNKVLEVPVDVCEPCLDRMIAKASKSPKSKKMTEAIKNQQPLEGDVSIEDLL